MSAALPEREPSRDELLAELIVLRQKVADLRQERDDLETMLEMTTEHADHLSDALQEERDDLEMMLEVTTEHSDALEEELQHKADELEARNQFVRETFGRYVSDDVVAQLLDLPEGLQLGGEKRKVSILMSDVRGFTALAEHLDPQEVLTFLNRYLEAMLTVILSYQGTIIEILGDGLLVIFGAPIQRPDDAERAIACAVAMQLQMVDANAANRQDGLPEVEMGIGIHTGEVVVGNIGSQQRTKYGAVGSAVNLSGRIESYTTGGQILISETTFKEAAPILSITQQMRAEPKGVAEPITIYEVGGIGGEHHLFLPELSEELVPLNEAIPISYTVLEEKFAGRTVFAGRLMKLAVKSAELHTDHPLAALSNLKLQLMPEQGNALPGDVFAKVVGLQTDRATRVVIRFTSLPENARVFLQKRQRAV
jgi:adenylate cyclase